MFVEQMGLEVTSESVEFDGIEVWNKFGR